MTQDKLAIVTAGGSAIGADTARKTEKISAVIAFLACNGGGTITGQNQRVDGGITRSECAMYALACDPNYRRVTT